MYRINTGKDIIPSMKPLDNKDSSGVFRFHFWRFGNWLEVLVDDLIPTKDGVPIFTYSKDKDEFWGALLEKAYAK